MNNVVNIEDNTPYKGGYMPKPQINWHSLYVDLQEDFDLISKDNAQQQRIIDNQEADIKYLMSMVARLELDKKRLQEQLQKKKGWGKWINYKR